MSGKAGREVSRYSCLRPSRTTPPPRRVVSVSQSVGLEQVEVSLLRSSTMHLSLLLVMIVAALAEGCLRAELRKANPRGGDDAEPPESAKVLMETADTPEENSGESSLEVGETNSTANTTVIEDLQVDANETTTTSPVPGGSNSSTERTNSSVSSSLNSTGNGNVTAATNDATLNNDTVLPDVNVAAGLINTTGTAVPNVNGTAVAGKSPQVNGTAAPGTSSSVNGTAALEPSPQVNGTAALGTSPQVNGTGAPEPSPPVNGTAIPPLVNGTAAPPQVTSPHANTTVVLPPANGTSPPLANGTDAKDTNLAPNNLGNRTRDLTTSEVNATSAAPAALPNAPPSKETVSKANNGAMNSTDISSDLTVPGNNGTTVNLVAPSGKGSEDLVSTSAAVGSTGDEFAGSSSGAAAKSNVTGLVHPEVKPVQITDNVNNAIKANNSIP